MKYACEDLVKFAFSNVFKDVGLTICVTVNEFAYCDALTLSLSPTFTSVVNLDEVPVIVLPPAEKPIEPDNTAVLAVSVNVK